MSRSKLKIAIAINAIVIVLEAFAISVGIAKDGFFENFMYYTELSNLLGAIACAVCLVGEVRMLRGGDGLGRGAKWVKFAATCCLLLTFLVVVAVLAPMLNSIGQPGYYLMFVDGVKSITHLVGPVLVTVSYIVFEGDRDMTLRESLVGFVPTLAYAAVAYPCNAARLWDGPYPFLQVLDMPIWMSVLWFVALSAVSFGLCQVPRLLAKRVR